jgi:hypothetical protein
MIYGELGRYPLDIDIQLWNVSHWAKLITGKDINDLLFSRFIWKHSDTYTSVTRGQGATV